MSAAMVYIIILLGMFMLFILLIRNYKEPTSWILSLMSFATIISTFAGIFFINKFGSYPYPESPLLRPDFWLYLSLITLWRIPYHHLLRMVNIGVVLSAMAAVLMAFEIKWRSRKISARYLDLRNAKWLLVVLVPLAFYVWFNDPISIYRFHLRYRLLEPAPGAALFLKALRAANLLNQVMMFVYFSLPIAMLARRFFSATVSVIRRQIASLSLSLLLLNGFTYYLFFLTSFRITNLNVLAAPLFLGRSTPVEAYLFTLVPIMAFALIGIISFIFSKYALVGGLGLINDLVIRFRWNIFNRYLRGYLHSFKNILFTNKILAQRSILELGRNCESLVKIERINEHHLQRIGRALDALKRIRIQPKNNPIAEAIEQTLGGMEIPSGIRVVSRIEDGPMYARFDAFHLHEAMYNLIQNALESILLKHRSDGVIEVEVFTQFGWIVIQVTDNGMGLDNRMRKEIFQHFYSTKSKERNFGIGLSYVYRIIKDHQGIVFATGKPDEYATFYVLLPRVWQRPSR